MLQRIAALLIVVCVFSLPTSAQDTSARAVADEYLKVVGTETLFPEIKSYVVNPLLQLEPFQRPELREPIERIADAAFDPQVIRSAILDRMETKLAAEEMQPLIDYYNTEFGQKMVAIENAAGKSENQEYLFHNWEQILADYENDAERNDAVLDFIVSTDALELPEKIGKSVALTIIGVRLRSIPPEQRLPLSEIEAKVDQTFIEDRKNLLNRQQAAYLFGLRSASTEDIRKHTDTLSNPANRKVSAVVEDALISVMNAQLEEFLTEVYRQTDVDPKDCDGDCK